MQEIISFLTDLKDNNNREWFINHKPRYDKVKGQFVDIVEQILVSLKSFEPQMEDLKAQQCIFRINRDIRFSADKSPYKSNFGAFFSIEGKNTSKAGYYIQIAPDESFVGGGMYMPNADLLKKIRQEIDYNFDDFQNIIESKSFKDWYPQIYDQDKLSRPPKGYDAENPAIAFLKLKHHIYSHDLAPSELKDPEKLVKTTVAAFRALKPYNDFLNQCFEI